MFFTKYITKWSVVLVVLQPFWWRCVKCPIHHERDVREEKHYMWHEQAIIVISSGDLYCCLLPQCETLCKCHLGFLITTVANMHNMLHKISNYLNSFLFGDLHDFAVIADCFWFNNKLRVNVVHNNLEEPPQMKVLG